jgi:hypothetical protein
VEYILEVNFEIEVTLPFLVCGIFLENLGLFGIAKPYNSNFDYFRPRVSEESNEN